MRAPDPPKDPDRLRLMLIFLLSRRCNLACEYCNVDAGPHVTTSQIGLVHFESWVRSFAELGNVDLVIQLHGGEPLILVPTVETYAEVARNTVAQFSSSRLLKVELVTNGLALDRARATSLAKARIQVQTSIDGTAETHDRFRRTITGKGSHRQAMRGLEVLMRGEHDPVVLSVVSRPEDVISGARFFIEKGVPVVKMNPVRPQGRGQSLDEGIRDMQAMAESYLRLAQMAARHNARHPGCPFYEDNINAILTRILDHQDLPAGARRRPPVMPMHWALLIDERQALWAHPNGRGRESLCLLEQRPRSVDELAAAIGLDTYDSTSTDRIAKLEKRRHNVYTPCPGCADPFWCALFTLPASGRGHEKADLVCTWREALTGLLTSWASAAPEQALHAVYSYEYPLADGSPRSAA